MNIKEFEILPKEEMYNITFNEGKRLHSIIYNEERTVLYSLYMFFVEIIYDQYSDKRIGIKCFNEGFLLSRYARSISDRFNGDQ